MIIDKWPKTGAGEPGFDIDQLLGEEWHGQETSYWSPSSVLETGVQYRQRSYSAATENLKLAGIDGPPAS